MVLWAKDNAASSGLKDAPIRYIVDDVIKFVEREIRRGNKYDAIIMDPPTYGRGPNGEVWKFDDELWGLIQRCIRLLSDNPLFMIVNSYTSSVSSTVVSNVLNLSVVKKFGGYVTNDEIALPIKSSHLVLPCGAATRWIAD
jgi:23S rRNA (cytosine1962-C5)-methyltransferase